MFMLRVWRSPAARDEGDLIYEAMLHSYQFPGSMNVSPEGNLELDGCPDAILPPWLVEIQPSSHLRENRA